VRHPETADASLHSGSSVRFAQVSIMWTYEFSSDYVKIDAEHRT